MPENEIWVFYSEAEAKLSEARIKDSLMAPSRARLDARAEIMEFIRTSRGRTRAERWYYDNRPWAIPDRPLDPDDPLDAWRFEIPEKYRSTPNEIEAEGSGPIPHAFFCAGGQCHFEGDNLVGLKRGAERVMIEASELKRRAWQRGEEVSFDLKAKTNGRPPKYRPKATELARELFDADPSISIESAFLSIQASLGPDPDTGKPLSETNIKAIIRSVRGVGKG